MATSSSVYLDTLAIASPKPPPKTDESQWIHPALRESDSVSQTVPREGAIETATYAKTRDEPVLAQQSLRPFPQLPPEILGPIMVLAAEYDPQGPEGPNAWSRYYQARRRGTNLYLGVSTLKFGWVSSYWRLVAISTPELWSTFVTIFPAVTEPIVEEPSVLKAFELMAERAGNTLWHVIIHGVYDHYALHTEPHPLLAKLLETSHRWKRAEITMKGMFAPLFTAIRASLPHLECVTLRLHQFPHKGVDMGMVAEAPLLKEARVFLNYPSWFCHVCLPPYIQHITFSAELPRIANQLRQSSTWKTAEFRIQGPNDLPSHYPLHHTLPHLERLHVRCEWYAHTMGSIGTLLNIITAPQVTDMCLMESLFDGSSEQHYRFFVPSLKSFLNRSSCHITTLQLSLSLLLPRLREILRMVPAVRSLTIIELRTHRNAPTPYESCVRVDDALIDALTFHRDRELILPHLEHLDITAYYQGLEEPESFLKLVHSRQSCATRLTNLVLLLHNQETLAASIGTGMKTPGVHVVIQNVYDEKYLEQEDNDEELYMDWG